MAPAFLPPAEERALGLGFYATSTPGVGGTLKDRPESFRVTEVSRYPIPDAAGTYTVLRIISRNWEQHELSMRIAQRLGLPPHALSWAGTKDRRAVAERLASYRGRPPGADLALPGVEVIEAYSAREGLSLGHHYGNGFAVRLGGLAAALAVPALVSTRDALRTFGGIPNFFGPQRFGEVRPITHRVGRALVRGDVDGAVELYLSERTGSPEERGSAARAAYATSHDAVAALREFPHEYKFERILLDHLAKGHPADRALRGLSRELRTLFVHAFQALLFNRYLTERKARALSFQEPTPGDHLLRIARDGTMPGRDPVPVSADNLGEASDTVRRGRAVLAGPLIGHETPRGSGIPGEIVEALLAEEGIERGSFILPRSPDLASAGTWRPLLIPVPPIAFTDRRAPAEEPSAPDPGEGVWLRFGLPKGSYATVLLREFQKIGATPTD
ncbi:MAG: tRNA pseudouridine(13) synthase TruD [Thermoplasmata archaeon]|nr:tRNA pseudouridine(13) synthase TruD [Thermoplasmata archaeon]